MTRKKKTGWDIYYLYSENKSLKEGRKYECLLPRKSTNIKMYRVYSIQMIMSVTGVVVSYCIFIFVVLFTLINVHDLFIEIFREIRSECCYLKLYYCGVGIIENILSAAFTMSVLLSKYLKFTLIQWSLNSTSKFAVKY